MRLTLKVKLGVTFAVVVALSGVSMFIAIQNLGSLNDGLNGIVNGNAKRIQMASEINASSLRIARDEKSMIIATDQAEIEQFGTAIAEENKALLAKLAELRELSGEEGKLRVDVFTEEWNQFMEVSNRIQDLTTKNSVYVANSLSLTEGAVAFDATDKAAETLAGYLESQTSVLGIEPFAIAGEIDQLNLLAQIYSKNLLLGADPADQEHWNKLFEEVKAESQQKLQELEGRIGTSVQARSLLEDYASKAAAWREILTEIIRLGLENANYYATELANGEGKAARAESVTALNSVIDLNNEQMTEATADAGNLYNFSRTLLLALLTGSTIIAAVAATWIVVAISKAIGSALNLANAVAAGDLSATATVSGNDEIKDLIDALNLMTGKLKEVVAEVTVATRNVAAGSQEMSAASEQLSQGATEQASSTEEASSSMEQMAANIKQSADNAGQTEKIARQSAADAEASGKAVADAVKAMETIAEKILIVQEIARQTDLLALNAAVEAARAGEHGRGFAVVASEVRKLAERSQAAAQEISGLSGDTVKAAQSAGEMLTKLVPDIQKTAELIAEISAASNEQNAGASQINAAIQQLDKVTQQNTGAAEEMSATAEELASQAEQLQATISYFRLDDRQAAPAQRLASPAPVVAHLAPRAKQPAARTSVAGMQEAVKAAAPQMAKRKGKSGGGFALDMDDGRDALDSEFARQSA